MTPQSTIRKAASAVGRQLAALGTVLKSAPRGRVPKRVRFVTESGEPVWFWIRRPTEEDELDLLDYDGEESDRERRGRCVVAWESVESASGEPIPFTIENLNTVLSADPDLALDVDHYLLDLEPIPDLGKWGKQ